MEKGKIITEKELLVLESLYRLEDKSVSSLAKKTLINRTTLYPILEKLLAKGLVSKVRTKDKKVLMPIPYPEFADWLDRRRDEFRTESKELETWGKKVASQNTPSLRSEVYYFEGHDGIINLYTDTWKNNEGKEILAITDYRYLLDTEENYFKNEYFPTRIKKNIWVKALATESALARKDLKTSKNYLREMKLVKNLFKDLQIEINIYDDKVAIAAFDKNLPSGVLIKNEKIAKAMRHIFEYLWKRN